MSASIWYLFEYFINIVFHLQSFCLRLILIMPYLTPSLFIFFILYLLFSSSRTFSLLLTASLFVFPLPSLSVSRSLYHYHSLSLFLLISFLLPLNLYSSLTLTLTHPCLLLPLLTYRPPLPHLLFFRFPFSLLLSTSLSLSLSSRLPFSLYLLLFLFFPFIAILRRCVRFERTQRLGKTCGYRRFRWGEINDHDILNQILNKITWSNVI